MQQQITISMIESKDFRYKTRGYDPKQVDDFLDDICDEMARMLDVIDDLQRKVAAANVVRPDPAAEEPHVAPMQPVVQQDRVGSETMQEMIAAAARFKEQIEQEAKDRANSIIAEAQERANSLLANAETQASERLNTLGEEHDRLAAQVEELRKAAAEYREGFLTLLKQQKQALENAGELFE